jgi:4-hydroxy-2-oxoheptanedioate aldolase
VPLAAIAEIAAVPGVDGVFIGPSDLAADMGHLGNPGHPRCRPRSKAASRRVRAAGKPVGMLIADEALARRYLELGASFVAVGTDVTILARGAEAGAALRRPGGQDAGVAGSGKGSVY